MYALIKLQVLVHNHAQHLETQSVGKIYHIRILIQHKSVNALPMNNQHYLKHCFKIHIITQRISRPRLYISDAQVMVDVETSGAANVTPLDVVNLRSARCNYKTKQLEYNLQN